MCSPTSIATSRATTTSSSTGSRTPNGFRRSRTTASTTRPHPDSRAKEWYDEVFLENVALSAAWRVGRRFPSTIPGISRQVTRLIGRVDSTEQSYRVFTTPRFVRFYEMEYGMPRDAVAECLRELRSFIDASGLRIQVPVEVRFVAGDDIAALDGFRTRQRVHRVPRVRRARLRAVLPRRGADHERGGRPSALGQAALPDGGDAGAALSGVGPLPSRVAPGSTPTGHSRIRTSTACSAESRQSLGLVGGRHRPRHALVRVFDREGARPSRSRARTASHTNHRSAAIESPTSSGGSGQSSSRIRRARPPPTTRRSVRSPCLDGDRARRHSQPPMPSTRARRPRRSPRRAPCARRVPRSRTGALPRTATASERPFDSTVHRVVSASSASVVMRSSTTSPPLELDRGERDRRRRRERGLVLLVLGERVLRLPRHERKRDFEHTSVDVLFPQVLATEHPLVGGDRGERTGRQMRRQLGPGVRARRHLGQRPESEPPRPFGQHAGRPLPRRFEREAVLRQRRRWPQLLSPLQGPAAAVAELDEPVPIPRRAELIDRAHELVEIALLDDLFERPVTPSATDSGVRTDRSGRPVSPRPPWPGAARQSTSSRSRSARRPGGTAACDASDVDDERLGDGIAPELPDHRAQLRLDGEAQAVVDRVDPVIEAEKAVPALAVGVVHEEVEDRDRHRARRASPRVRAG